METVYLGDRKISIRTSILEEKATACNMLCCYADELKEGFLPYVEQVRSPFPSLFSLPRASSPGAMVSSGSKASCVRVCTAAEKYVCERFAPGQQQVGHWVHDECVMGHASTRLISITGLQVVAHMVRASDGAQVWVIQVAGVMIPLLKFYFHEEVRSAAAQSLPELLRSAVLASKKGQAQGSSVKQLLEALWQPLIDAIQKVSFRCAGDGLGSEMYRQSPMLSHLKYCQPVR